MDNDGIIMHKKISYVHNLCLLRKLIFNEMPNVPHSGQLGGPKDNSNN
jgi:hypothetical protein